MSQITNSGNVKDVTVSQDGQYIAYVVNDSEQHSLWIKQVAIPNAVSIIPPTPNEIWGIIFSQDGDYIYYIEGEKSSPGVLYRVPALGGTPQKLFERVNSS